MLMLYHWFVSSTCLMLYQTLANGNATHEEHTRKKTTNHNNSGMSEKTTNHSDVIGSLPTISIY